MSYYLYDSRGFIADGPSTIGLEQFAKWATGRPAIENFVALGQTSSVPELVSALEETTASGSVESTRVALLEAAKKAKHVLIISDGVGHGDDEEEPKAASNKDQNVIHDVADKYMAKFSVAVRYAFAKGRVALGEDNVEKAAEAVYDALLAVLPKTILGCLTAAGHVGTDRIMPRLKAAQAQFRTAKPPEKGKPYTTRKPFNLSFNANDPDAAAWAKAHALELARDLSDTTRDNVKAMLDRTFKGEATLNDVRNAVGDSARADVIARTESMKAANEGQRQAWDQAKSKGLLSEDTRRVWIATSGCCDDCDELDGELADLDGEYPADGADGPPLHPNCRCTEGISEEKE